MPAEPGGSRRFAFRSLPYPIPRPQWWTAPAGDLSHRTALNKSRRLTKVCRKIALAFNVSAAKSTLSPSVELIYFFPLDLPNSIDAIKPRGSSALWFSTNSPAPTRIDMSGETFRQVRHELLGQVDSINTQTRPNLMAQFVAYY